MRDEHFNNLAALGEAMVDIVEQNETDETVFHEIASAMEPCLRMLDVHCDSLLRENDGKVKTVELMYDELDDPDFTILPGEAETVVRRKRVSNRIAKRFSKLLKKQNKSMIDSIVRRVVGGLLDGEEFFGFDDEEEELCNRLGIAEEFSHCFDQCEDKDFGCEDIVHLLPLSVCFNICKECVDALEGKAESLGTELEGDDAEEYAYAMDLMEDTQAKAIAFKKNHPDAPLEPFDIDEDDLAPDSGEEEEDE